MVWEGFPVAPSPGSITDVTQRLQLWLRRQAPGLAKVEYSSEFSRQAVLEQLQPTLNQLALPLYEIPLPTYQAPGAITDFLNQTLDQFDHGLVSITGFTTAFDPKVTLADALRQLNMHREVLARRPLQQIWWMLPIFSQNSALGMPDLTSWFTPRLRLTEVVQPARPHEELMNIEGTATNLKDARQRAYGLIERFQKADSAGASTKDLLETYLLPALEALAEVNAYKELQEITSQFSGLLSELKDSDSSELLHALNKLGILYYKQGRYSEAGPLLQRVLAIRKSLLGEEHLDVATSLNNLAGLYESQGRYSEAEPLYQQALTLSQRLLGEDHPNVATSLNNLAFLYESQGRYGEAEPLYQQALTLSQRLLGEDHPNVATSLNNLAGLYKSQGRYGEAEPLYQQALRIAVQRLGKDHPNTRTVLENIWGFLQEAIKAGRTSELSDDPMTRALLQKIQA